ncbi:Catechol 2,3-dioxygenase [Thalassobacillus cyri]|uniref:Catechol 2,3-dioxygenase n=1 Tax=Thalassobacillus cyri TaxID=571932 RepID=A0A1H3WI03_9BACI|nr:ArsI/CadI family heavy metal resistance metalloenzyme [Thalassobacillus cyri]SDZ86745.1 Catechol 2,3-dioxygenase [Thalassobacillus cyri]
MNVHVGLNVVDLEKSIEFYTKVFGEEPVKVKSDYAKFMPEKLQLNFTLNVKPEVSGNQVGHFGIQVEKQEDIDSQKARLEQLRFFTREETNTTCCYALQDKFWITDPDGNEWEFFYTKQDVVENKEEQSCCQ